MDFADGETVMRINVSHHAVREGDEARWSQPGAVARPGHTQALKAPT